MSLQTILEKLVSFESITPKDVGCHAYMMQFFTDLGFDCQTYDSPPATNFFARFGSEAPLLVFAGHSDVVPIGEASKWESPPFTLTPKGDRLYGRGVADMKGSLACMMLMAKRFIHEVPNFKGSLGFLITSAEEGDFFDHGTPVVMEALQQQSIIIDYCIVGEPSSTSAVGDVIKVGRRGSLTAFVELHGKQGHVAYPHLARNPIHQIAPALAALTDYEWDAGNRWFPPTTMQISQLMSGGQASNVIPGELQMTFNFRFSTEQTPEQLQEKVEQLFEDYKVPVNIRWRLNGLPFITEGGRLLESTQKAIQSLTQRPTELSTSGGTSDARFIAPYGVEVIELGPVNESIHKVNEWVSLSELELLTEIYYRISCDLLGTFK